MKIDQFNHILQKSILLAFLLVTISNARLEFVKDGIVQFAVEANGDVATPLDIITGNTATGYSGNLEVISSGNVVANVTPADNIAFAGAMLDVQSFSNAGLRFLHNSTKETMQISENGNAENLVTPQSGTVYYGDALIEDYFYNDNSKTTETTFNILSPGGNAEGKQIEGTTPTEHQYRYFLKDHLGSTRAVIDDNFGTIQESYVYYAYGKMKQILFAAGEDTKQKFTGKEFDWEGVPDSAYLDISFTIYEIVLADTIDNAIIIHFETGAPLTVPLARIDGNCAIAKKRFAFNVKKRITRVDVITHNATPELYYTQGFNYTIDINERGVIGLNEDVNTLLNDGDENYYDVFPVASISGIDLVYFGARYLDPDVGIWNSVDPMEEFWNSYSYCGGNPINYTDPLGLWSEDDDEADADTDNAGGDGIGELPTITVTSSMDGFNVDIGIGGGGGDTYYFDNAEAAWQKVGELQAKWDENQRDNEDYKDTDKYGSYGGNEDHAGEIGIGGGRGASSSVGAPGFWEGMIPIWGSGRAAINDFQTGHPVWGTVNAAFAVTDVLLVKALVTGIVKQGGKAALKGICFAEGTLVYTQDGFKNIENIEVGDFVLTRDEKTGTEVYRKVIKTYKTEEQAIYSVDFGIGNEIKENLKATADHPFYVKHKGWMPTNELNVGDTVLCSTVKFLTFIGKALLDSKTTVYNFNVDEYHSYFVGNEKLWVHNSCRQALNPIFKTNKEAAKAAAKLGFSKTNYKSMGQAVFKKGNYYITADITGHNGGAWKMARSIEELGSKSTRMGTYDINLLRIGD